MKIKQLSDDAVVAKIIRYEEVKEVHWTGKGITDKEAAEQAIKYFIVDEQNKLDEVELNFIWGKICSLKLKPENDRLFWIFVYYTDPYLTYNEARAKMFEQIERLREDVHFELYPG